MRITYKQKCKLYSALNIFNPCGLLGSYGTSLKQTPKQKHWWYDKKNCFLLVYKAFTHFVHSCFDYEGHGWSCQQQPNERFGSPYSFGLS